MNNWKGLMLIFIAGKKQYFYLKPKIMKTVCLFFIAFVGFGLAQAQKISLDLSENKNLAPFNVEVSNESYKGKPSLKVLDPGGNTEVKFVKINDLEFKDGTIELELSGAPAPGTTAMARGFVGIAFRISDDNSKFNIIYLRPTNGRADDQLRRNHSVQYVSFPDHPWHRLRKESPGKYETYVDLVPREWIKVKIVVKDKAAYLYVHDAEQPTLIVNELLGDQHGRAIGLWIGPGTEAHFSNPVISEAGDN
jgi:hypothetical protein